MKRKKVPTVQERIDGAIEDSTRYVRGFTVPKTIPKNRVLVHNQVQHKTDTPTGWQGFRAWTQKRSRKLVPCNCGWAGLRHYRVSCARTVSTE